MDSKPNGNGTGNIRPSSVAKESMERFLEARRLPALSVVAGKILAMAAQDPFPLEECVRIVGTDAALCAKLLRLTNSSYFGIANKVESIEKASRLLGELAFRSLAVGLAICSSLPRPRSYPFDGDLFWLDNLRRAELARALASQSRLPYASETFAASLLQNVGIALMADLDGIAYGQLLHANSDRGEKLCDLEDDHYGWNHADLGATLADHWRFPPALRIAIEQHHEPLVKRDLSDHDWRLVRWVQLSALLPSARDERPARWRDFFRIVAAEQPGANLESIVERVDDEVLATVRVFSERDLSLPCLGSRFAESRAADERP